MTFNLIVPDSNWLLYVDETDGFRKLRPSNISQNNWWEFRHPFFCRNKPELLSKIKKSLHFDDNGHPMGTSKDNSTVVEMQALKKRVVELESTINHLTTLVQSALREGSNDAWQGMTDFCAARCFDSDPEFDSSKSADVPGFEVLMGLDFVEEDSLLSSELYSSSTSYSSSSSHRESLNPTGNQHQHQHPLTTLIQTNEITIPTKPQNPLAAINLDTNSQLIQGFLQIFADALQKQGNQREATLNMPLMPLMVPQNNHSIPSETSIFC